MLVTPPDAAAVGAGDAAGWAEHPATAITAAAATATRATRFIQPSSPDGRARNPSGVFGSQCTDGFHPPGGIGAADLGTELQRAPRPRPDCPAGTPGHARPTVPATGGAHAVRIDDLGDPWG